MSSPAIATAKRYTVALRLSRQTVINKMENARTYVHKMSGNPDFPAPHPALATVTDAVNRLEAAWEAAQDGTRTQTQIMYQREVELNTLLAELGHYVEDTANASTNPPAIITSAGMDYKHPGRRHVRPFAVHNGTLKGTVHAHVPKAGMRAGYVWQYRLKGTDAWQLSAITLQTTHTYTGLASSSTYEFRMAVVTKAGQGDWTGELELVVL